MTGKLEKFVIYSYLKNSRLIRSKSVNSVNSFNPPNYKKHTITNQVKRTTELEIKFKDIFSYKNFTMPKIAYM